VTEPTNNLQVSRVFPVGATRGMALCGRRRWRRDRRVRLLLPAMYPETLPQVRMISRAPGRHWGSAASPGYGEHERGRAQAAPKHGVHGLAQWSNPRAQHPVPRCATSGGMVLRVCDDGYRKHGRAPAAKGRGRGRAPGTGLLRQPEARRTMGIRPSGVPRDGHSPGGIGGAISGAVRAAPL